MKKLLGSGLFTLVFVMWMTILAPQISAQGPAPSSTPGIATPTSAASPTPVTSAGVGNTIPLSLLGYSEQTLRGPFDSSYLAFSLPGDWQLSDGAQLQLVINTYFNGTGVPLRLSGANPSAPAGGGGLYNGEVEVLFNNISLTRFSLDKEGERTITIPITPEALQKSTQPGRHSLQLLLTALPDCDYDWHTAVVVRPASRLILPHQFVVASTDLRQLPRPIYQGSFVADTSVIVIPDKPTARELQAAFSVAAGFGRMSRGKLSMALKTAGQLTTDDQKNNHLIFVGNPTDFAMLKNAPLPAPVSGSGYNVPNVKPEDGIVQMVNSPINPARVWLIAGGNQDTGIVKAAQAISAGVIKATAPSNLAVVAEVQTNLPGDVVQTDRTLANLGYQNVTVQYLGTNFIDYQFYVPPGQMVNGAAYLDLAFSHSTLAEYERSGILVRLNDEPLGSVRLSDETAQTGTARIAIPRTTVHPGYNRLSVAVDLFPRFICMSPSFGGLWATVRAESVLHLPLGPAPENDLNRFVNLATFPDAFTTHPTLGTTAFVLPASDPVAWEVATQIAFGFGTASGVALPDVAAVFADAVPDALRKSRDLVIIGRPSALPIIGELRDALPAPFEPGSDLATERNMNVIYRIAPGTSVGYLEMFPAPWSTQRIVLTVLGSTDQGLRWAGNALTVPQLRGRLGGNYAFVNGEQIVIGDTRITSVGSGVAPTALPAVTPQVVSAASDAPLLAERPAWILPVLSISILMLAVVLLAVAVSSWRQRVRRV